MSVRKSLMAASATALIFVVVACGDTPSASSNEPAVKAETAFEEGTTMARLAEAGKITVGTKFDQPLFGLKGLDGTPQGFDVEIAKIIAGELGISVEGIEWSETPTKVRDEAVSTGKVDIAVATYTINESRKERVTFGGPYYRAGTQLMVPADSEITGPDTVASTGAKVCTATGASYHDAIAEFATGADQIVQFDVYSKCADALRTGQVDAVAADSAILLGLVSASEGQNEIVGESFYDGYFGIGIKKGDIAFCEFVNETLEKSVEDGRYAAAWAKSGGTVQAEVPALPEPEPCK